MALEDILEELLSKSGHLEAEPGGTLSANIATRNTPRQDQFTSLLSMLEVECNQRYHDPGPALHFVGILLSLFAAEVVSAYWARNEHATTSDRGTQAEGRKQGSPQLISCLYSSDAVAFAVSPPLQVPGAFSVLM
jgi:hypothetical protein